MFNGYFHYLDAVRYGRGAVMVPRFENGDLLLVRLQRAPAIGMSIEFPRGGVDVSETEAHAAVRELREETGFDVALGAVIPLGKIAPDTATINGFSEAFLVNIPMNALQGAFDAVEIERPMRVTQQEFGEMVARGDIIDAMTLGAWTQAQAYLAATRAAK